VTFILWAIAGMLLFQHWIVVLLGVPIFPLTYIDLIRADKDAIKKFGDDYKRYMERVPRMNFLIGILQSLRRRRKQSP
jgi:protein-S-isoprenylcysteine O-methyltransferase Ste14